MHFQKCLTRILAIICFFTCTCSYALPPEIEKILLAAGYKEIPIHSEKNTTQYLVDLSLNKKPPQHFLIDNGTIQTLIYPNIEKEFSFKKEMKSIPVRGGGGTLIAYREVLIPEMSAGNFHTKYNKAYYPEKNFKELAKLDYVGILGANFLREHHAYIDTENKTLYLLGDGVINSNFDFVSFIKKITDAFSAHGYQHVFLTESSSRHQTLPVSINKHSPITFMLDTGSGETLLSLKYANIYKLHYKLIGGLVGSEGGNIKVYQTFDVNQFQIGNLTLKPKHLSILDYKFIVAGNIPIDGTVGRDWLDITHAVIDMTDNILYVHAT